MKSIRYAICCCVALSLLIAECAKTEAAQDAKKPKYSADVPEFLLTPDKVKTELLGDLEFFDGMPSEATV